MTPTPQKLREDARAIFDAAVHAVDAEQCVQSFVSRTGDTLTVDGVDYDLGTFNSVYVVGAGKASPRMAKPLVEILGDRLTGVAINT